MTVEFITWSAVVAGVIAAAVAGMFAAADWKRDE